MDEGIVEGCEDSCDTEDKFTFADLGTEGDILLGWTGGSFLGRHFRSSRWLSFVRGCGMDSRPMSLV